MKATVDKNGCISCGLCVSLCPEVFRMDDNNVAEAYAAVTSSTESAVTEARDGCPVDVISIDG